MRTTLPSAMRTSADSGGSGMPFLVVPGSWAPAKLAKLPISMTTARGRYRVMVRISINYESLKSVTFGEDSVGSKVGDLLLERDATGPAADCVPGAKGRYGAPSLG